jgi:hypothetical protein
MENIELLDGETFKKHPRYPYRVSNMGRVIGKRGRLMVGSFLSGGYTGMCISETTGKSKTKLLHRMVVETFVGEIPPKLHVDHKNGVKSDNRLENLEVVTCGENNRRAFVLGLRVGLKGIENPSAVLTDEDVLKMYDLIIAGASNKDLAAEFNVHERYVSLIRHGKRRVELYKTHAVSKARITSDLRGLQIRCNGTVPDNLAKSVELLKELEAGNYSRAKLSEKYGVHPTTISHIKSKKAWKKVWEVYEQLKSATTIEKTA